MNRNLRLGLVAVALLAASIWLYADSVSRGDRFTRGQKLLPNLNPDEVATISVAEGENAVTLERRGDEFTVAEADDYPARNDAVNRFLRELLDITLDSEAGSGEALAAEVAIEPATDETTEVALLDRSGSEMVRLRFGRRSDDGGARFVRRIDGEPGPIHLTTGSVQLSSTPDAFLRKELLDVARADLSRIAGPDYVLGGGDAESLDLQDLPSGRKERRAQTNKIRNLVSGLRFDEVFPADDAKVGDLRFEPAIRYELSDGSAYTLSTASDGERTFVTVSGSHSVDRVEIALDTPDEELEEKAELLSRGDEIRELNDFHGSWVYAVPSSTAETLALRRSDLLDDA